MGGVRQIKTEGGVFASVGLTRQCIYAVNDQGTPGNYSRCNYFRS